MNHHRDVVAFGHVVMTPDPPAVSPANATTSPEPTLAQMDGQQLVQWLTVQAGDLAGALQHGVRVIMLPALHRQDYEIKRMKLLG